MYKKPLKIIVAVILILSYLTLIVYNIIFYDKFFEAPIYHLINITVAVVLAYYFVQKRTDQRKLKEVINEIVVKIQVSLESKEAYTFSSKSNSREILQIMRMTKNRIEILSGMKNKLNIIEEVEYINDNFQLYRDLISDYIDNLQELSSREPELRKLLNAINTKCDILRVKLYQ